MVNLRELSPPEWCNSHVSRRENAGTCTDAYIIHDGLWFPCYHDAAASKCKSAGESVNCSGLDTAPAYTSHSCDNLMGLKYEATPLPQPQQPIPDDLMGDMSSGYGSGEG